MHLQRFTLRVDEYPTRVHYPFFLPLFLETREVAFPTPVTLITAYTKTFLQTAAPAWESEIRPVQTCPALRATPGGASTTVQP